MVRPGKHNFSPLHDRLVRPHSKQSSRKGLSDTAFELHGKTGRLVVHPNQGLTERILVTIIAVTVLLIVMVLMM